MPTPKTRLNISLPDEVRNAISELARRDRVPQATKAARLLEAALEVEEDQIWNAMAEKRDAGKARYVRHDRAWKRK
jgi:predicted transcriptional regulator